MKNFFKKKVMVVGHRGARTHYPDNTLASFQKAIELKTEIIEFDIRKTKDNVLIVFHDACIGNTPVEKLTYKKIIHYYHKKTHTVHTYQEILEACAGKIKFNIELKETGYERDVIDMTLQYCIPDDFFVTSFYNTSLYLIKQYYPGIITGLLIGPRTNKKYIQLCDLFFYNRFLESQADLIILHWSLVLLGYLYFMHKKNIAAIIWTVNSPRFLKRLFKKRNIAAVITDDPEKALAIRNNTKRKKNGPW